MTLLDTLRSLDYWALPLSNYSRQYIHRMLPVLDYYLLIYNRTLDRLLSALVREPSELTLVDYGGGHGFFSLAAKKRGVGRVVYVDINPQAAEAVQAVSRAVGFGPDVVITGDAATLRQWCSDTGVRPDALVGMDVVEHIYRLDAFFADIFAIDPAMPVMLTTGSNASNPFVVRRIRQWISEDEYGYSGDDGYSELRRRFIREHFPELTEGDLFINVVLTRGLTYDDIPEAVRTKRYKMDKEANTCDPRTGNWTERLLTIDEYHAFLAPHSASLRVANGYYNPYGRTLKAFLARCINPFLRRLPFLRCLAPFITLEINIP